MTSTTAAKTGEGQCKPDWRLWLAARSIKRPNCSGAFKCNFEVIAPIPFTGTGSRSVLIAAIPGWKDSGPPISISNEPSAGKTPFGFGLSFSLPANRSKTGKGLPQHLQDDELDVVILSGTEDFVNFFLRDVTVKRSESLQPIRGDEKCCCVMTTWCGRTANNYIANPGPSSPGRIVSWLTREGHDDEGNVIVSSYNDNHSAKAIEDSTENPRRKPSYATPPVGPVRRGASASACGPAIGGRI